MTTETTASFTTGQGITVVANPPRTGFLDEYEPLNGKHHVEVTFPSEDGDPITACRIYANHSASKDAAKAIAGEINKIAKTGFPSSIKWFKDHDKANRNAVETLVREWAGEDGIVITVED